MTDEQETNHINDLMLWQNEAAAVMAQFIHLSDHPDSEAWGIVAMKAARLLNVSNVKVRGCAPNEFQKEQ